MKAKTCGEHNRTIKKQNAKMFLILIFSLFLGVSSTYSAPSDTGVRKGKGHQKAKVKLVKLWEGEFDDEIEDIEFPSDTEIDTLIKKGKPIKPKHIKKKKRIIKFKDEKGNVVKDIDPNKFGEKVRGFSEVKYKEEDRYYNNVVHRLKSGSVLIENRVW